MGTQTVEWELQSGDWVLVLMNADGSQGVDVAGTIGAKVPSLFWLGIGLLIGGVIVLAVGVLMVYLSVRRYANVEPPCSNGPNNAEKACALPDCCEIFFIKPLDNRAVPVP